MKGEHMKGAEMKCDGLRTTKVKTFNLITTQPYLSMMPKTLVIVAKWSLHLVLTREVVVVIGA